MSVIGINEYFAILLDCFVKSLSFSATIWGNLASTFKGSAPCLSIKYVRQPSESHHSSGFSSPSEFVLTISKNVAYDAKKFGFNWVFEGMSLYLSLIHI